MQWCHVLDRFATHVAYTQGESRFMEAMSTLKGDLSRDLTAMTKTVRALCKICPQFLVLGRVLQDAKGVSPKGLPALKTKIPLRIAIVGDSSLFSLVCHGEAAQVAGISLEERPQLPSHAGSDLLPMLHKMGQTIAR
jgi:hypothetical protein